MNKIILLAIVISTLVECCLGFGGPGMENNEDLKKIKAKLCDEKVRPDATQMEALSKCFQPCNGTAGDAKNEQFAAKMKADVDECLKSADDVNNLKGTNEQQNNLIYKMCSQKFKQCLEAKMKKSEGEMNKNGQKPEGDKNGGPPKSGFQDKLDCGKKALGIA